MEELNVGITREKKEDLRVQIQIIESDINHLKETGDKYGQLPEKQRVLDYLKKQWKELDKNLGKTYSDTVRESTEQILEENKNSKEVTPSDITINEQWALDNHYKQIASMQREYAQVSRKLLTAENYNDMHRLGEKKERLEKELEALTSYTESDVIRFAKIRKAAYLNAKQRYRKLSAIEKLKMKLSGKEITWDKIKDDPNFTEAKLDSMYHSRSK